jgi:hypothetical protein
MLFQGRCWAVLGSVHRCASLVGSAYDVSLTEPVGGERCACAAHARDRARLGRGLRGPDTTVLRVEGSRLLQVFSAYLGIDTTTVTSACVVDSFVNS